MFFVVELYELSLLDINPSSEIWFANIFSHLVDCLLILLLASFAVQKHFSLMLIPFVYFYFCFPCLRKQVERISKTDAKGVLPMFSSRSFMISGFIFKSLIHFELIFLYSVTLGSGSYLFCMWLSSFPIYWRYYPLSIVCSLLFCHKLLAHICMDVFLDSRFCFIDLFFCQYHAVLITVALLFEIRKWDTSSFVLFFFSELLWLFGAFCGFI